MKNEEKSACFAVRIEGDVIALVDREVASFLKQLDAAGGRHLRYGRGGLARTVLSTSAGARRWASVLRGAGR